MSRTLLVGQAGGATAVINSSLVGVIREAQSSGQFRRILGMRRGAEGVLEGDIVDLTHPSPGSLDALAATPGAALGSSRHKLSDEDEERLLNFLTARGIDTFVYIGGNDSADTAHRLACLAQARNADLRAIAVPKTIDNDLPVTDHSPGYGSIARYVALAAMDSAKDTESMPTMYPVKFVEVMGRDAGWVAAAAALGRRAAEDAPHLIYMPEFPLSRDKLLADVDRVYRALGYVVAVVTETVRDERGRPFADAAVSAEVDAFGHPLLRGTADSMCRLVQNELGLRSRFDKPGSLQRMSMQTVSPVDLREAEEVGRAAVQLALRDRSDRMVTIVRDGDDPYRSHTGDAPLSEIANRQQLVPRDFVTDDLSHVTQAFVDYARPLLGPDPLPQYVRLRDVL
jgi:ATP-dependent phosphofructokinase / diphosphate-dependent phosphofructokinase